MKNKLVLFIGGALALLVLPVFAQHFGDEWVRILDNALLYMLLALGLNIVVGYAGLLDLGYIAFYAVGAYTFGLLASPHLTNHFDWWRNHFPGGLHIWIFAAIPLAAVVAGGAGVLLGTPTLKLRGDYLAIVTLGFGEIIRVFLNNLEAPVNVTNGPRGIDSIDSIRIFGFDFNDNHTFLGIHFHRVVMPSYYLFVLLVVAAVVICYRLERSRIGRAWMAIREDEIAAKAMGINTRNMKLLAFGMGATFGGISGVLFSTLQGFVSPESFSLQESIIVVAMVVVGGIGHIPGVLMGALLLSALPEVLRYVGDPLREITDGRIDAAILRQLLVALAMIVIILLRPRGLWQQPEHAKAAPSPAPTK